MCVFVVREQQYLLVYMKTPWSRIQERVAVRFEGCVTGLWQTCCSGLCSEASGRRAAATRAAARLDFDECVCEPAPARLSGDTVCDMSRHTSSLPIFSKLPTETPYLWKSIIICHIAWLGWSRQQIITPFRTPEPQIRCVILVPHIFIIVHLPS